MFIYLPIIKSKGGRVSEERVARTRSFGINPRSGGRPPRDRRVKARIVLFAWELVIREDKSFGVLIFI